MDEDEHVMQWRAAVTAEVARRAKTFQCTAAGRQMVGNAVPGGVTAYESTLLPYMLDMLVRSTTQRRRLSGTCYKAYTRKDGNVMWAIAGSRADVQYNGEHLKQSTVYAEDGSLKSKLARV